MPLNSSLSSRKQTIAQYFAKAHDYTQHAYVQQQVCQLLLERVSNRQQTSILEIGAGSGQLTQLLANNLVSNHWHINELANTQTKKLQQIIPTAQLHIGDAENIVLGNNHSLIISANTVQWFDNPLKFIEQSVNRLSKGGQLLFNTFTPNNFKQIKQLTGQGLHYPTIKEWEAMIKQHGLTNYKLTTHPYELVFETPYQVLQHIKHTGVSTFNTTTDSFAWTKSSINTFIEQYKKQYTNADNKVVLTYEGLLIDINT